MKLLKSLGLFALMVGAVGCGTRVEVPPAHSGVIVSSSGVDTEDVKAPSSFRLPVNFLGTNPTKLLVFEQSDQQKTGSMDLFVPEDQMLMHVDYRGRFTISNDKAKLEFTLARMPAKPFPGYSDTDVIDFDDVWNTYGDQITMTTSRKVLSQYSIAHVTKNRESINEELFVAVNKALEPTPLTCSEFGLSEIQPPELIVQAQKLAKERRVAIQSAEASKIVRITEAESDLEVALKKQMNDLLEADTQRQVAEKLTKGVNHAFVQQRVLGILEKLSTSNGRITVIPEEALENPSLMMAVEQDLLKTSSASK